MKTIYLLLVLLIFSGCKGEPESNDVKSDDVEDFMEQVFGESKGEAPKCSELVSKVDFSDLCIAQESKYKINKDVENALICLYVLKSKYSTVDIAINSSPMSMITGQIFKAAKSDAEKKGSVEKIRRIGKEAFYHESEYKAGDYSITNKDLVFYKDKTMYTLHTASGSNKNPNCMANESELKKLAKALLEFTD